MSALDKIIAGIFEQAGAEADGILNEARQRAAEILERGEAARAEQRRQLEEVSERECQELAKRAESADRQNRRLALLETRNQALDEVIAEAKARLAEGADQTCFNMVWQGDILLNNSIDAIFEAENQTLRDRAYEALTL